MALDEEGFAVPSEPTQSVIRRPPPMADVGKTFDGCISRDEAIAKVINELSVPASIERDGFDAIYRRLADGLILLLAIQGGLSP